MNEDGAASVRNLFWVVFLGLSFYIGYLFVPPYVRYYAFKTHVEDESKLGRVYTDAALAKRLYGLAEDWSIPIEPEDIQIVRFGNEISVSIYYVNTVDVAGLYQREMEYFIETTMPVLEE